MTTNFAFDLRPCKTIDQLALALGIDVDFLRLLTDPTQSSQLFVQHRIVKRNRHRANTHRVVYEAIGENHKLIQKTIARRLSLHASYVIPEFPLPCAFGFIRNRSIKDNASEHVGARFLVRADIRNFFPTISRAKILECFSFLQLDLQIADLLTNVYCIEESLAQGLSGSPLIANLACHHLDKRMIELCALTDSTYTRYADDISISGTSPPDREQIEQVLEEQGFALSTQKFRKTKLGQPHFVTGLSISDPVRPHVPKAMKRRLRQEIYYASKYGISEHITRTGQRHSHGLNRIDGMVKYVSFIEKDTSYDYRAEWNSLLCINDLLPTYTPRKSSTGSIDFVIDETEFIADRTHYLSLGCAVIYDTPTVSTAIEDTLANYLAMPFSLGKKDDIKNNGLHFADSHPELKTQFIAKLATLPFRIYIMAQAISPADNYRDVYISLLQRLTFMLYPRHTGKTVRLTIENNSKVKGGRCEKELDDLFETLKRADMPRPASKPTIMIASKKNSLVAIPDYMLGVFNAYLRNGSTATSLEMMQFERLRDRFSYVFNVTTQQTFSRKNPLQPNSFGVTVNSK